MTSQPMEPLSIPPSQYWDGNDGRWSSFHVTVGTQGRVIRLLPGTSAPAGDAIWLVLPEGCEVANPDLEDCSNSRGNLFERNASLTWSTSRLDNGGLYTLNTLEESKLGLTGNAYYGFDTVTLGLPGSGMPTLTQQLIAGIADNDFWIGSLGLSPWPLNFTELNEPIPSLMNTLRQQNNSIIPSTTWSYTAGAVYKEPPVFASLVLGGYDSSRFDASSAISIPFWADQSRDLQVAVQAITYDTLGSSPLLTDGIYAFVNSMVTHMWLPVEVCTRFEQAFGLQWDNETQLYLLNETTHSRLRGQNPTINFTVGASVDSSNTTIISMPYAAFDHNVTAPFVNGSRPYFPLKRAQDSTQYTLGRVFLQEAYLVADYDRKNFTLAQALFPPSHVQNVVTILSPNTEEAKDSKLSTGAIVGMVLGAVAILGVAAVVLHFLYRRRRSRSKVREVKASEEDHVVAVNEEVKIQEKSGDGVNELEGVVSHELPSLITDVRTELPSRAMDQGEVPKRDGVVELPAGDLPRAELGS